MLLACSLLVATNMASVVFGDGGPDLVELETSLPWLATPLRVNYSLSCRSFVYGSAAWPWAKHAYGCDSFFLYYEPGLLEGILDVSASLRSMDRELYLVLDPDPPAEGTTFVDLYYDRDLWLELVDYVDSTLGNLSGTHVDGFVIGDEWPRGLNNEEITVGLLASHNVTYHRETGFWIREAPGKEEKETLAEWFYARSVAAWDELAREVRRRHPEAVLGTNIDLAWEPDLSGSNIAHWKPRHWWLQLDLSPYDFVVTHYFTRMPIGEDGHAPDPSYADAASLHRLGDALKALQDAPGVDVYLLLGAHCSYPYVTTPMQMVSEWNLAMGFSDRLAGVGWFIFDLWISNDGRSIESMAIADTSILAPLKIDRLLTLRVLLDGASMRSTVAAQVPGHNPLGLETVWRVMLPSLDRTVCGIAPGAEGGCVILGTQRGAQTGYRSVAFLMAIDATGKAMWVRTLPSRLGDFRPSSMVRDQAGGYLVAGIRESRVTLLRLDDDGGIVWERGFDGGALRGLSATDSGCILACGSEVMNLDRDGRTIWTWEVESRLELRSILWIGDGDCLLAGRTGADAFVAQIDAMGRTVWEGHYGDWWPLEILRSPGGYLVAGGRERICDLWCWWGRVQLTAIDTQGDVLWNATVDDWIGEECGYLAVSQVGDGFAVATANAITFFGLGGEVLGNASCQASGLVGTPKGHIIAAGPAERTFCSAGNGGIRAVELDRKPTVVWDQTYMDTQTPRGVLASPDGGYFVIAVTIALEAGVPEGSITKLDADGNVVWRKEIPMGGIDAVASCRDGGIALAGPSSDGHLQLARVDQAGNLLWRIVHDLGGPTAASCMLEAPDGGFLVSGTLSGPDGADVLLLMTDDDGNRIWQRTHDLLYVDEAPCIIPANGLYTIVGNARDLNGTSHLMTVKSDAEGREIESRVFDFEGSIVVSCAILTDDGCLVLGGCLERRTAEGPCLLKLDAAGELVWEKVFQWEGRAIVEIAENAEGGYWLFGHGGSMVKVGAQWEHIWDTCWAPVDPGGLVTGTERGTYLMAGSLCNQLQVVRLRDRVPELPHTGSILATILIVGLAAPRSAMRDKRQHDQPPE